MSFFKFDIQANSNLIDELLVTLSNLPKDKQEKKIQAIIDLLKE